MTEDINGNLKNLISKKILVVGLGRSGVAATQVLTKLGAIISVQDAKTHDEVDPQLVKFLEEQGVDCYFNRTPKDIESFDMIILSPGVSPELYWLEEAKEKGVEIVGELEIAYRIGRGTYIAITGTNGKTTTTTLVGEIFKKAKRKTHVVGNIGTAVISKSAKGLEDDWFITEASSFQLETTKYFKPAISCILNLTPDHLNRHHTMKAYGEAKSKIFANQREDGYLVINCDDKLCYSLSKKSLAKVVPFSRKKKLSLGCFVEKGKGVIIDENKQKHEIFNLKNLKIIGDHNLENALAASAISFLAGIDPKIIGETVEEFGGVEHRIEFVADIEGIKYFNDSKGTNVEAALTAIKALDNHIILIGGGDSKSQDFSQFAESLRGHVKALVLMGRDKEIIGEAAKKAGFDNIFYEKDLDDCVKRSYSLGEKGDKILLSPACASWDMYENFEQRGEHFKDCVRRLED